MEATRSLSPVSPIRNRRVRAMGRSPRIAQDKEACQHSGGSWVITESPRRRGPDRGRQMKEIEALEHSTSVDKEHVVHLLREKEMELQTLYEECDINAVQREELDEALAEAQTIIEEQQDQLTEFRRRIAQSEADFEAYKLRNLFLNKNSVSPNMPVQDSPLSESGRNDQIEALSWQLMEQKRRIHELQNENDQLKIEWERLKMNEDTPVPPELVLTLQNLQKAITTAPGNSSDQEELMNKNEEMQQYILKQEEKYNTKLEQYEQQIRELRENLSEYRKREKEWKEKRKNVIHYQQELENEGKQNKILIAHEAQKSELNSKQNVELDAENLAEIRRICHERNRWKAYACGLLRAFAEHCEGLLEKTTYDEPRFETAAERRWYNYSIHLLELILEEAPNRLTESDLELLKRTAAPRRLSEVSAVPCPTTSQGPDILSTIHWGKRNEARQTNSQRVARLATKSLIRP